METLSLTCRFDFDSEFRDTAVHASVYNATRLTPQMADKSSALTYKNICDGFHNYIHAHCTGDTLAICTGQYLSTVGLYGPTDDFFIGTLRTRIH